MLFLYNTDDRIIRNAVLERGYGYVYRNKIVLRRKRREMLSCEVVGMCVPSRTNEKYGLVIGRLSSRVSRLIERASISSQGFP